MSSPLVNYGITRAIIARQTHVAPGGSGTGPARTPRKQITPSGYKAWMEKRWIPSSQFNPKLGRPVRCEIKPGHLIRNGICIINAKDLCGQRQANIFGYD